MNIFGKQKILVPQNVDLQKWAVVACDQFTSEPSYWQKLDKFVGDSPSTLRITLPEIYLSNNLEQRIQKINKTMEEYLEKNIFKEIDGFVLVERQFSEDKKRLGLVMSVDLEFYDWKDDKSAIRATEETIVERLPARINIRKGAKIELPHILLLINDSKKDIIEKAYSNRDKFTKLYDFELNMNGGHIRGYHIEDTQEIAQALLGLLDEKRQLEKYGKNENILFIVGDGNHSLATAKSCWEEIKLTLSEEQRENHPARYALVEVMNIYDDAMVFEPIHRVLINCDESFINELSMALKGDGKLKVFTKEKEFVINGPYHSSEMISAVQEFIESYIEKKDSQVIVDYVHGDSNIREVVCDNKNAIGILMPYFAKEELFDYVINKGNLPKKAFSIDRPEQKKYYVEAKRIK